MRRKERGGEVIDSTNLGGGMRQKRRMHVGLIGDNTNLAVQEKTVEKEGRKER